MSLVQMSLAQMSLSGAVMILAIAVIRALAINKLPKKAFLALWGVVAVRLLIPYSFRSAFSVYSLLGRMAAAGEAIKDSSAALFAPSAPVQNRMSAPGDVVSYMTAGAVDSWGIARAAVAADPWVIVWAAGALVCAVFFATVYWKCRREFNASLPVDNDNAYVKAWLSEHRIYRPIEIRQSGRISAPLTYGVFRPVILMPKTTDWDDQDTLKYVLAHEYVHIRRFDAVTKLALTAALCVHWFNPAVWLMYVLANRDIELSCDETVIRRFGERAKSAYAMALIRMEETRSGLTPLCNNFSKNAIEERIIAIMKIKKTSPAALIASAALIAGMTTAFATSAQVAGNAPAARFTAAGVEWWTYDEYKAWLENEKVELQGMIGQKAWTGSRGEFIWTQEIVDETIAMYEGILENIKNGMLYSKTIDGGDVFCTLPSAGNDVAEDTLAGNAVSEAVSAETAASGTAARESVAGEISAAEGNAAEPGTDFAGIFEKYAPFGITYEEAERNSRRGNVYYNGQLVSRFADLTPDGGAFTFTSAEQGGITVKTVYDDDGRLTGVEVVGD